MRLTLSVVVPTHGRREALLRCLQALVGQELPGPWELIVVDDASQDGTWPSLVALAQGLASQGQGPHWRLRRLGRNLGRAGARQVALAQVRSPWVVFVDDDVILGPGALAALWGASQAPGGPWLLRGRTWDRSAPPVPGAPWPKRPEGALAFVTNHAALPTELLRASGGFDPAFVAYGWEDLELGERLQALGGRLRWAEGGGAWHVKPHPEGLAQLAQLERERGAMGAVFWRRHPTWAVALMVGKTPLHALLAALTRVLGANPEVGWGPWGPWVRGWPGAGWHWGALALFHLGQAELRAALRRPPGEEGAGVRRGGLDRGLAWLPWAAALAWGMGGAPLAEAAELGSFKEPASRQAVIAWTREALQASLYGRQLPPPPGRAWPRALRAPAGAFVTLSRRGHTRLCWGTMAPRGASFMEDLWLSAMRVPHWDLRQGPIQAAERRGLMATVAMVGRSWPLGDWRLYRPRSQGLWLHGSRGGAVLLPGEAATAAWAVARLRASAGLRPREAARMDVFEAATLGPFEVEPT